MLLSNIIVVLLYAFFLHYGTEFFNQNFRERILIYFNDGCAKRFSHNCRFSQGDCRELEEMYLCKVVKIRSNSKVINKLVFLNLKLCFLFVALVFPFVDFNSLQGMRGLIFIIQRTLYKYKL